MPNGGRRHALFAQILHGGDVANALCHLGAVGQQELAVAPDARKRLPRSGLRLRDLVLVVREDEIYAAAMKVEGLPQILH